MLAETTDLIDADGVADLLGLAQRNSVSLYQRRYSDMPRPVVDLGERRVKLWLRSEMIAWSNNQTLRPQARRAQSKGSGADSSRGQ